MPLRALIDPRMLAMLADSFPDLCSIKLPPAPGTEARDASGQQIRPYTAATGLSNIPCRVAPIVEMRPGPEQARTVTMTYATATHVIKLQGYYSEAQIPPNARATISGVEYDVMATEPDGSRIATRLRVQIVMV